MRTAEERIAKKCNISDSGCHEFMGHRDKDGYGKIRLKGKMQAVHRVIYRLKVGDIPDKYCVCHRCDNPSCCNPDHLFLGTHQDNMIDMTLKGRRAKGEKIGCRREGHPLSKLTEEQICEIRAISHMKQRDIADLYGITQSHVSNIKNNVRWKEK